MVGKLKVATCKLTSNSPLKTFWTVAKGKSLFLGTKIVRPVIPLVKKLAVATKLAPNVRALAMKPTKMRRRPPISSISVKLATDWAKL